MERDRERRGDLERDLDLKERRMTCTGLSNSRCDPKLTLTLEVVEKLLRGCVISADYGQRWPLTVLSWLHWD